MPPGRPRTRVLVEEAEAVPVRQLAAVVTGEERQGSGAGGWSCWTGGTAGRPTTAGAKRRWQEIGRGRFVGPSEDRVTINALLDGLALDYQHNRRRSVATLAGRLAPLRAAFGEDRAVDVTAARVERYKADRLAGRVRGDRAPAAATVNRELAALKRAFGLAIEQERLTTAPRIKLLAEDNAREGFLDPGTFGAVARWLLGPLDDFARFAYLSGWRKGEVQSLTWSDVERAHSRVTLRRAHSKTREPRVLVLVGELAAVVERRWAAREYPGPGGLPALSAFVFHRAGRPVGDFRKAWATACDKAGVSGTLFHDLRRSAIRNFEKAGVSQAVAMKISGHRTASVYRRYRIVDEGDIRDALARTDASLRAAPPSKVSPLAASGESR